MRRWVKLVLATLAFALAVTVTGVIASYALEFEPIGPAVAPNPAEHHGAVVQIYGANVWGFRGNFAVHTWVAVKEDGARAYTLYQVIGWGLRRYGSAVSISEGKPNRYWFRSPPKLLFEASGDAASRMIPQIKNAVAAYPYEQEYVMWPGPNSNSFVQWIVLSVPELEVDLPAKAIGKNWMIDNFSSSTASPD